MACEDFPCCGHEHGCCPDFNEAGEQLNMVCVCGAKLPIDSRYSICESCMRDPDDPDAWREDRPDWESDDPIFDMPDDREDSWLDSSYEGE